MSNTRLQKQEVEINRLLFQYDELKNVVIYTAITSAGKSAPEIKADIEKIQNAARDATHIAKQIFFLAPYRDFTGRVSETYINSAAEEEISRLQKMMATKKHSVNSHHISTPQNDNYKTPIIQNATALQKQWHEFVLTKQSLVYELLQADHKCDPTTTLSLYRKILNMRELYREAEDLDCKLMKENNFDNIGYRKTVLNNINLAMNVLSPDVLTSLDFNFRNLTTRHRILMAEFEKIKSSLKIEGEDVRHEKLNRLVFLLETNNSQLDEFDPENKQRELDFNTVKTACQKTESAANHFFNQEKWDSLQKRAENILNYKPYATLIDLKCSINPYQERENAIRDLTKNLEDCNRQLNKVQSITKKHEREELITRLQEALDETSKLATHYPELMILVQSLFKLTAPQLPSQTSAKAHIEYAAKCKEIANQGSRILTRIRSSDLAKEETQVCFEWVSNLHNAADNAIDATKRIAGFSGRFFSLRQKLNVITAEKGMESQNRLSALQKLETDLTELSQEEKHWNQLHHFAQTEACIAEVKKTLERLRKCSV